MSHSASGFQSHPCVLHWLKLLTQLKSLNISGCRNIDFPAALKGIGARLPCLQELHLPVWFSLETYFKVIAL